LVHSNVFNNRLQIYTKQIVNTPTGDDETDVLTDTVWASILEMPIRVVDYDQNESQKKLIKITIRGRKEIDVTKTEFRWKTSVYKPLSSSYLASRTDTQLTVLLCHKTDGLTDGV
jgi:head-tail adaptor